MDDPEGVVAVGHRVGHDAQRQQVVDLFERPVAALHLREDAVEMLGPAVHRGVDAGVLQGLDDGLADLVDQLLPFRPLLVQLAREIPVDVGRQVLQAEVFQFGFDLGHAEPVGEGRVDLPRFEGDALLLLLFQEGQRPHVVEPVRELDEDDPHVLRHGNEHLAEILGLEFLLASEGQPGDLGDAVHQDGHFLAEFRGQLFNGHLFHVFHHVVQEPRRDRHGVQLQADQRKHHLRTVHHEGFAGLPDLPGVVQGAEMIGPFDEVQLGFQRLVGVDFRMGNGVLLQQYLDRNDRGMGKGVFNRRSHRDIRLDGPTWGLNALDRAKGRFKLMLTPLVNQRGMRV